MIPFSLYINNGCIILWLTYYKSKTLIIFTPSYICSNDPTSLPGTSIYTPLSKIFSLFFNYKRTIKYYLISLHLVTLWCVLLGYFKIKHPISGTLPCLLRFFRSASTNSTTKKCQTLPWSFRIKLKNNSSYYQKVTTHLL